jgi:glutamate synthase (NADPH) large chain
MKRTGLPPKQGLYDPQLEKDSCGVGFVVNIKGKKSHQIVEDGITILKNLAIPTAATARVFLFKSRTNF